MLIEILFVVVTGVAIIATMGKHKYRRKAEDLQTKLASVDGLAEYWKNKHDHLVAGLLAESRRRNAQITIGAKDKTQGTLKRVAGRVAAIGDAGGINKLPGSASSFGGAPSMFTIKPDCENRPNSTDFDNLCGGM